MFELRQIQKDKSDDLATVVRKYRIGILAGEVRSGKTLTVLATAEKLNKRKVLFVTKKKAMSSIQSDFVLGAFKYEMILINYESVHKADTKNIDLIICDESHSMGAFPTPSKRTKAIKKIAYQNRCDVILSSGTPTPESFSQIYHQLWVSYFTPFHEPTFYKWANNYVNKYTMKINGFNTTKYDKAKKDKVEPIINPLRVVMTQAEAGFKSKVNEHFEMVEMKPITYSLCKKLTKDLVIEGNEEDILADTSVKLQQKLHQMYSGTVKFESGAHMVIDDSKAVHIKKKWNGQKIAIFYKFIAELEMIKSVYGEEITTDLDEFNETNKSYAGQIVSSREGVNLSKADVLVFLNIDFSAVSYFQARDRLTVKDRPENDVFWIFSKGGIESRIYQAVSKKKNFTLDIFKKHYQK